MRSLKILSAAVLVSIFSFLFSFGETLADSVPPQSSLSVTPPSPNGINDWYVSPLETIVAATDLESGVRSINWRVDLEAEQVVTFSDTLNLSPNPSFEDYSGGLITSWTFSGAPSSQGLPETIQSQFGQASAKIISVENGWNGFNNRASYIPSTPFANMTASVWIKTSSVQGNGAYFKIYALGASGETYLTKSLTVAGTTDWIRVSKNFYVSASDAHGVYLDLGLEGTGTIYIDGLIVNNSITDTAVPQTFSQNGSHQIEYYATDNSGNEESPRRLFSYKLDTLSPLNWREFSSVEAGNDHTLSSSIKVDDLTSGIDASRGFFQYSVDGSSSWGYYSDLTKCSSTWVSDGWKELTTTLSNGGKTAVLETPAVDYCNSNWAVCKTIRFKTSDSASNTSTRNVCINGPWLYSGGDVGSRNAISLSTSGGEDNTDGVIYSASSIDNFSSSRGWQVLDYLLPKKESYEDWVAKFSPSAPLPSGKLPTVSGLYQVGSSFTISGATLPSNLSTAMFSAVIFIEGDLVINSNFSLNSQSALAFIVNGDIFVDKNVTNIYGAFFSEKNIDLSYNGNSGDPLVVTGSLVGETISFGRSLKNKENTAAPAEKIIYRPANLLLLVGLLGESRLSWRELTVD